MKAAFAVAFALALFASTGRALAETQSDSFSFAVEGGETGSERVGVGRACTTKEFVVASYHCDDHHAPFMMSCHLTSCIVRNGWIVYTWDGYYFG